MDDAGRVREALTAHRRAETRAARTRGELHAAIVAAINGGMRQSDLVTLTGYSREHLRQIARREPVLNGSANPR